MAGKTGSYANLAAVSKGSSTPLNGLGQAVHPSIVGLNAGGGRRPLRPRSLSGAQARTDSLDLAQPSTSTGSSSVPSGKPVSELNNGRKLFFGSMREVGGVGETVLRLCGGELVLKVVQEPFPRLGGKSSSSRPTSIIESTSHSRRASQIGIGGTLSPRDTLALSTISTSYKRCSTSGGQRDSGTHSSSSKRVSVAGSINSDGLGALRVDVKAGSLESLLDVLIFGVDGLKMTVKDDTGLETGSSRRLLLVDLQGYRTEFFATFRTFTTPITVFEVSSNLRLIRIFEHLELTRPLSLFPFSFSTSNNDITRVSRPSKPSTILFSLPSKPSQPGLSPTSRWRPPQSTGLSSLPSDCRSSPLSTTGCRKELNKPSSTILTSTPPSPRSFERSRRRNRFREIFGR